MNKFEKGLLTYLSQAQLDKIQSVKIGIGGAGGLGSNIAIILVRSGFKNLEILDCDIIEASNLNRQQYYVDEIGESKIEVLRKRLLDINPDLNLKTHNLKWSADRKDELFKDCNFIVEAFDNADFKKMFVEYYQDKTKYVISGNGMAGLVTKTPLEVKRIGNIYFVGDNSTDTAEGHPPMAPRVTQCAAMMAGVILELTLK